MRKVAAKDRARVEEHASPEALAAMLAEARAEQRALGRYVEWVEALLERRTAEKAAGTWPAIDQEGGWAT
jgi:hypothetical protein